MVPPNNNVLDTIDAAVCFLRKLLAGMNLALHLTMARQRLWSSCMSEVKFFLGMLGQFSANVRQFVLLGFATTRIFAVGLAYWLRIAPWDLNIALFNCSRSVRSMPGFRAWPPRKTATSMSLKATAGSSVISIDSINAKAQSSSCIKIPFKRDILSGNSSNFNLIGVCSPKTWPHPSRT